MDDSNTPATKADLAPGLAGMETRLNERHDMLRSETQRGFDELKETMRDGKTALLNAFNSFARSAGTKLKDEELADLLNIRRQS